MGPAVRVFPFLAIPEDIQPSALSRRWGSAGEDEGTLMHIKLLTGTIVCVDVRRGEGGVPAK